jgi:sugar lactone lactonase YvrE
MNRRIFNFKSPGKILLLLLIVSLNFSCSQSNLSTLREPLTKVQTLAGAGEIRFGEVFGIAVNSEGAIFISDGANGKIWRVEKSGETSLVTDKLDTPSALVIDKDDSLVVADSGSHTIKRINPTNGEASVLAGIENRSGFADGAANQALFNAPIGIAVAENKIYVADTYNDLIRVIENGTVKTLAGGENGFADGFAAKFDTPCGVVVLPDNSILVADTGNRRIRKIATDGAVSTFAGTGEFGSNNGFSDEASFVEPTGILVDQTGAIYVADAGANSIRVFNRRLTPFWETAAGNGRGTSDSALEDAKFNRPTNLAIDNGGNLFVADSSNKLIRIVQPGNSNLGAQISAETGKSLFLSPAQMRERGEARWTYNPPERPRDVAGTFGELRGAIRKPGDSAWFHNGLDIAGALGETTVFIRDEKVLRLIAVEDFDQKNNRERLRMPTIGYIHIRLGRDASNKPFGDGRFLFQTENGKLTDLRVPRGVKFKAGEALGTLNPFNHVHLIAGETGAEMNALDALVLPGARDTIAPKIEKITFFGENWNEIKANEPLRGRIRIAARGFDQMDGGSSRRRLGIYRLGYQVLKADNSPISDKLETISFERLPDSEAANLVYAVGSQSGYTPETVFNYIVSNRIKDGAAVEDFLDTTKLPNGDYKIRVFAADFFGNETAQELNLKIRN